MIKLKMPPKGSKVTLSSYEVEMGENLGKLRYKQNREAGNKICVIGGEAPEEVDMEGICAEIAFCKLFNVYFDPTQYVRKSRDNTDLGDCTLLGFRVDVKSTKLHNGRLLNTPWKNNTVHVLALMTGQRPEYVFRGFMKSSELLTEKRLDNLGRGPTYVAKQDELKNFKDTEIELETLELAPDLIKVESPV